MSEHSAAPDQTHALVVGIEQYDAGSSWDLDGPARDALEFYRWLLESGVPKKQIHRLLSPLDGNAPLAAESGATAATSSEVRQALKKLHKQKGDLLFLFWAGHGMISAEQERRLFYADATADDRMNLDLHSLLRSLGSSYFAGFRQILIVDSCANYLELPFELPNEELPFGEPLAGREQFVFLGARSGEVAKNLGKEGRGLFSRELMHEIRQTHSEGWPPDMMPLADRVKARIAALRKAGEHTQTPVYVWNQDWDGTAFNLGNPPSRGSDSNEVPESWTLSFREMARLTDGLLACKVMQSNNSRETVVRSLPSEIAVRVRRGDNAQTDAIAIVETALNYPGGIEQLLEVVRWLEGGSLPWCHLEKVARDVMPGFR